MGTTLPRPVRRQEDAATRTGGGVRSTPGCRLAIATLGGSVPLSSGLAASGLFEESYALVHASYRADPRSLPLVDWAENCGSYTRGWWAAQDWIPKATVEAEDDGAVRALVSAGHGMAIMPALSLAEALALLRITDLGPDRPTRRIGYVTTSHLAGSAVVRALVRELRAVASAEGALRRRAVELG